MNIFMFLTFFYMFIVLSTFTSSTFTTISYIPIEKRVPQNAQKAPPQSFIPAVGLLYYLVFLSSSFFLPAFQRVRSGISQRASARCRRDLQSPEPCPAPVQEQRRYWLPYYHCHCCRCYRCHDCCHYCCYCHCDCRRYSQQR